MTRFEGTSGAAAPLGRSCLRGLSRELSMLALACALQGAGPALAADAPRDAALVAAQAAKPAHAEHDALKPQAAELVDRGEAALARGAADEALAEFERAASLQHAPEIEMGIVRAQMQAGRYRRALAFAAHVAGAHTDEPAAAALYSWLLRAGGQNAYAQRVLEEAWARSTDDPVLRAARTVLNGTAPMASGELLQSPHRFAPYALSGASGDRAVAEQAQVVANAVLVDGGRSALAPAARLDGATMAWVRDGLGRTRSARVVRKATSTDIVLLQLDAPLPVEATITSAPRDPWGGSPGYIVEFAQGDGAAPRWPWLHLGFFTGSGFAATRAAGTDASAPSPAVGEGIVFDASGAWAGLLIPASRNGADTTATSRWVPPSTVQTAWPDLALDRGGASSGAGIVRTAVTPAARIGMDEAYERALPLVLQVIIPR